jgi:chain length determinant protein EpsF
LTLQQFIRILVARWHIAAGVFVLIVAASMVITAFSPKRYSAFASVMLDVKSDPVAGTNFASQNLPGYVSTQVDIASSLRVAQRVVRTLGLDKSDDSKRQWQQQTAGQGDYVSWLADGLRSGVVVSPSRESSVINIGVTWATPKEASELANAFARAYIDTSVELRVEPARQYATWFDQRSQELRADLEAKQRKLSDFLRDNGIIGIDDRLDIENQRLAQLSAQLVSAQSQRQDSQSRQRQARGAREMLPEIVGSPIINNLRADLLRAEARQDDILRRLGPSHPDYEGVAQDVRRLRAQIETESARVAASLTNATEISQHRESDVEQAFEAQKRRLLELKDQRDAAGVLQNDVITAQRNLDAVTLRLAQSSLESQTQQTNIVLLTPAVQPLSPSSPNKLHNLLLGILLGAFAGIAAAMGAELLRRRVRSETDFVRSTRLILIGRIAPDTPGGLAEEPA